MFLGAGFLRGRKAGLFLGTSFFRSCKAGLLLSADFLRGRLAGLFLRTGFFRGRKAGSLSGAGLLSRFAGSFRTGNLRLFFRLLADGGLHAGDFRGVRLLSGADTLKFAGQLRILPVERFHPLRCINQHNHCAVLILLHELV